MKFDGENEHWNRQSFFVQMWRETFDEDFGMALP